MSLSSQGKSALKLIFSYLSVNFSKKKYGWFLIAICMLSIIYISTYQTRGRILTIHYETCWKCLLWWSVGWDQNWIVWVKELDHWPITKKSLWTLNESVYPDDSWTNLKLGQMGFTKLGHQSKSKETLRTPEVTCLA